MATLTYRDYFRTHCYLTNFRKDWASLSSDSRFSFLSNRARVTPLNAFQIPASWYRWSRYRSLRVRRDNKRDRVNEILKERIERWDRVIEIENFTGKLIHYSCWSFDFILSVDWLWTASRSNQVDCRWNRKRITRALYFLKYEAQRRRISNCCRKSKGRWW